MKKILSVVLSLIMIFSFTTAYAEEFSDNANIEYDYDETYDETATDNVSSNYDDIETYYDSTFDETKNNSNGDNAIKVFINGKQIEFDVVPMLINGRTMVPMRTIFEYLGAEVDWDGTTRTAIGKTDNTTIKITIAKDYLLKNDNIVVLDSPAVIVSGRTLVPVRAIAESLDCKVEWYGETRVVEILK
ncbi:MAG: copper amine oxidase N-terminal domain-containing protein [Clostridia bacterium]|nr:copper amine oxidase N-terminal domain-containing protein [Clostridia bacterium]